MLSQLTCSFLNIVSFHVLSLSCFLFFLCVFSASLVSFPDIPRSLRWDEGAGPDVYKAARREPHRLEEDHRLHLHRQALAQHGEPAGHPGGGQLPADPPGARLLQSVPHLRGTKKMFLSQNANTVSLFPSGFGHS